MTISSPSRGPSRPWFATGRGVTSIESVQVRGRIVGTGSALPTRVLSNADLSRMVATSDEWIRERTGIQERRIAADGIASSDLGTEAAQVALARAGWDPASQRDQIGRAHV